jgi:hypothetical protein
LALPPRYSYQQQQPTTPKKERDRRGGRDEMAPFDDRDGETETVRS